MPSLRALEEFKSSFDNLGNELQILRELDIPPNDLPLPEHEPAPSGVASDGISGAEQAGDGYPADAGISQPDVYMPDRYPAASGEIQGRAGEGGPEEDSPGFGDLSDLLGGMNDSVSDVSSDSADLFNDDAGEAGAAESGDTGREEAAFGSFVDSIPDDFSSSDSFGETDISSDTGASFDAGSDEDFSLPPDLLNGFADEIEAGRAGDSEETDAPDLPAEFADGDFTNLFDTGTEAGLSGEEPLAEPADIGSEDRVAKTDRSEFSSLAELGSDELMELQKEEGGAVPDESWESGFGDGLDLSGLDTEKQIAPEHDIENQNLGDMNLSGDSSAAGDSTFGDDLNLADLGLPEPDLFESPVTGSDEPADFSIEDAFGDTPPDLAGDIGGFDFDSETQDFAPGALPEDIPGDSFDSIDSFDSEQINLDSDNHAEEISGADRPGDDFGKLGDFDIPEMDTVFDGGSRTVKTVPTGTGGGSDEADEIRLTEAELDTFQDTLLSYPLNLRIACEELIAEQLVAPEQMSRLVRLLVNGASINETAALAGKILGRTIPIPSGYEKKSGEELEEEHSSFGYIFIHNFLPVLRLFMGIALVLLSAGYLTWKFIYNPIKAEKIYKLGIERIDAGEYGRANERFREAFGIHEKKSWFYTYARAFRDARQYTLAEEKYGELLYYTASKSKRHIPEKAAVLEYADLEKNYIGNFEEADRLLRHNILDYNPLDRDALLALGDNSLAWGEYEPPRLEDARDYYARYMERYGRTDPLLERMLMYFIRTDNLAEVLPLQSYFMASDRKRISAAALAELGGYLLDKRYEKVRGVPNQYLDYIGGIREILLRAAAQDPMLPESYYHLARYYNYYENLNDEKLTLDVAVRAFDAAREETPKRIRYHILALQRHGEILIGRREFFPAEEELIKGINLYEDGLARRLLRRSPEFGKLYADMGDLEYFIKDGDMQGALDYYSLAERDGWAPPEIQYRMGAAHYQLRQWGPALDRIFAAYRETAPNRRVLYALGNVSYMRGNYFAAQGYYDRLLEILESDRSRLPPIMATDDEAQSDLAERLMAAQNNLGVTLESLTEQTGNNRYRSRAQGLYSDSERAWDVLTRNPQSMTRMRPSPDINAPGVNPAYLNVQNSLHPVAGYERQFFLRIDKDMLESSSWEDLAPPGYRLSEGIHTGR
jgi:tetratricopeptide (TPR) repeat protein